MSQLPLVPPEILHNIFLFVATDRGSQCPPSGIIPLILTNRRMHSLLCACNAENAHIYYALFFHFFDLEAPRRRMGRDFTTSSCCSSELRKRFTSIQRVRDHTHCRYIDVGLLTEDLCRCYFMLLESDDKNAAILFHYARLPTFIVGLTQEYLSGDWLSCIPSSPLLSFLLWNLWLVSSHNLLMREDQPIRNALQDGLLPCAISAWIFPDYPPSISPPPSDFRPPTMNTPPLSYEISLFSCPVTFIPPPPTPAAILAFCSRADAGLLRFAQTSATAVNPSFAPNVESVARSERFVASSVANLLQEDPITLIPALEFLQKPSARFDDDWARLQVTHLGPGHVHTPPVIHDIRPLLTIISGIWEGRMEYPTYGQYMGLRETGTPLINDYESLFITSLSLMARLRVYYCVDEVYKLRVPEGKDSILHAYLPREEEMNIALTNAGDLRIWDRIEGTYARYHLYDPIKGIPDDVDIIDVIIMGGTLLSNVGPDAQYIGRLNMANGLIVLLCNGPQLGKELLRGFIHHSQNFVGRWRTTIPPADVDHWEGPFLMGRRSEETIS